MNLTETEATIEAGAGLRRGGVGVLRRAGLRGVRSPVPPPASEAEELTTEAGESITTESGDPLVAG
jgi:hypothetical protein